MIYKVMGEIIGSFLNHNKLNGVWEIFSKHMSQVLANFKEGFL